LLGERLCEINRDNRDITTSYDMLTACMSSNNNEVLFQKDSLERSLTIELVTSYAWDGNRLNERITQFAADRPDIDITIRRNNT